MPANLTPPERKAWLRRGLQSGQLQIIHDGVPAARRQAATNDDDTDSGPTQH
jgi:hypothetical protein